MAIFHEIYFFAQKLNSKGNFLENNNENYWILKNSLVLWRFATNESILWLFKFWNSKLIINYGLCQNSKAKKLQTYPLFMFVPWCKIYFIILFLWRSGYFFQLAKQHNILFCQNLGNTFFKKVSLSPLSVAKLTACSQRRN